MAPKSSSELPLQTKGIYHSLPTFPDDIKDLTAIVTGANGISGFHTMRVLLESPHRWKKVWAASRRPPPEEMMALLPEDQRSRVEHVAVDFLSKPEEIAKQLKDKGVKADHIFVRLASDGSAVLHPDYQRHSPRISSFLACH